MLHSEHNTKKESTRTWEHFETTHRNHIWKRFFMMCVLCNSADVQRCEAQFMLSAGILFSSYTNINIVYDCVTP